MNRRHASESIEDREGSVNCMQLFFKTDVEKILDKEFTVLTMKIEVGCYCHQYPQQL